MFEKAKKAIKSVITTFFPLKVGSFAELVDLASEKKSLIEIRPNREPIMSQNMGIDVCINPHLVEIIGWRYFVRLIFETNDGEKYAYDEECGISGIIGNPNDEKELVVKTVNQAKSFFDSIKNKWSNVSAKVIET